MDVIIVCGLLGAGKTTFIQHLARTLSGRTVVLVNDFGKMGIDGEILSSEGIEAIELPSGCICCTLKFDLITTIRRITEKLSPDNLVIEPSGVASPSGVIEALGILNIESFSVIGVVDATEFAELYESEMYGEFFRDQVVLSDAILVNKCDLVEESEIVKSEEIIRSLNPGAVVFRTIKADPGRPLPSATVSASARCGITKPPHFSFQSFSLRLNPARFAAFEEFFHELAEGTYGDVVRAKALVRTERGPYRFDVSYGRVEHESFRGDLAEGRLVVIGSGLKRRETEEAVDKKH